MVGLFDKLRKALSSVLLIEAESMLQSPVIANFEVQAMISHALAPSA
jgi:hypothetical protein